ncbi:MAG: CpaD family pilus assembly protein [Pseudomonadota bacterium]
MTLENILRAAAIGCIMAAGSCAVSNDATSIPSDGIVNHPIAVEPTFREIKVQFAGGAEGLDADEAVKFEAFLDEYRAHGNGSLGISVPNGPPSRSAITWLAERAAATGIPRDKILVSTHDVANGDFRVDVSFIAYQARARECGKDWSENLAFTAENLTNRNLGCSVQRNIAAMVSDPRDLLGPRRFDPADARRAGTVIDNYQQGKITSADKRKNDLGNEQSGGSSDIGQ